MSYVGQLVQNDMSCIGTVFRCLHTHTIMHDTTCPIAAWYHHQWYTPSWQVVDSQTNYSTTAGTDIRLRPARATSRCAKSKITMCTQQSMHSGIQPRTRNLALGCTESGGSSLRTVYAEGMKAQTSSRPTDRIADLCMCISG